MNWIYRRESKLLLGYERQIARDFDSATFVSETEADLFRATFTGIREQSYLLQQRRRCGLFLARIVIT